MSKIKTAYFCSNCGYESTKWLGKCPSCNTWNSFVEEVLQKGKDKTDAGWNDYHTNNRSTKTVLLNNVTTINEERLVTADSELNRVLGGGIVPGSIILVAGEPGIGKSTLLLQAGLQLSGVSVLYISGEESEQQIKMRADRLKISNEDFYLLTETTTNVIFQEIKRIRPQVVIVDSINTMISYFIVLC
jgi:DNA repair protein RadA/Sms